MNQDITEQLDQLLGAGNIDAAKKLITEELSKPMSAEEKGGMYVEFLNSYMKGVNNLNESFIAEMIQKMKEFQSAEKIDNQLEDIGQLNDVRKHISQ